jgi:hypothetical protein
MSLAALDPLLPDPSPPLPTGGVPLVHQLLNEGTLAVDGADGVGMSLASLESAFLQNARAVDVDGDRGVGLRTLLVSKSVVANLGLVEVDGADAVGIDFDGESSTLIHGNGSSGSVAIPSLDPTTGSPRIDPNGVDPVFLPNAFSLQVEFDDEDGTFFPIGETRVTGFSPVGIRIEGRNNQVAIAKSAASIVGGDNVSSTVSAAGPGGIGVEILGSGTVLLNDGVIHGTDAAIVGSDGRDVVVNNNELTQQNPASGATVRLGGGDDFFQTNSTDLIVGLVDGGDGTDALRLFAGDSPLPQQFDLDTFVNFESLVKIGRGTMTAAGTLDLPTLVLQGTLDLAESTVLGDLQTGGEGAAAGRVTGNPRIEGTLDQRGGEVAPGNSPGATGWRPAPSRSRSPARRPRSTTA